jgi:hypothetical protein
MNSLDIYNIKDINNIITNYKIQIEHTEKMSSVLPDLKRNNYQKSELIKGQIKTYKRKNKKVQYILKQYNNNNRGLFVEVTIDGSDEIEDENLIIEVDEKDYENKINVRRYYE